MNTLKVIRGINAIFGRLLPGLTARVARRMFMRPRRLPARQWEQSAIDQAERFNFRNGLSAMRWGNHNGPIALCIHGWEGRGSQFAAFVDPLVAAGFHVIALDGPAHAHSPGKEANPLIFRDALLEVAEESGPLSLIIGHSMGAASTLLAINKGLDVQAAVCIASPASVRKVATLFSNYIGLPTRARLRFFKVIEDHTNTPMDSIEIRNVVKTFTTPGLIIHDSDDNDVRFDAAGEIVKNWPNAKLLATSGLGHYRILRDENVINTVVSFANEAIQLERAA